MSLQRGFIYRFKNPGSRHPFIFIENKDSEYFVGCMITSAKRSKRFPENIEMLSEYFKTHADNLTNTEYSIKFAQSNLVRLFLIKRTSDVNLKICGELTQQGLLFIDEAIKNKASVFWQDYENRPDFSDELQ